VPKKSKKTTEEKKEGEKAEKKK
jgi:hypothetical protein